MLPLMSGTRTRLDPGVRREQILAAARDVFVADDYAHASMEAVARSAGVTTGLVNHYFGTKRDLYLAVVADLAAGLPEMVDTDLPDLALEDLIARNMARFLDAFERNHEVLTMLLGGEGGRGGREGVAALRPRHPGRGRDAADPDIAGADRRPLAALSEPVRRPDGQPASE